MKFVFALLVDMRSFSRNVAWVGCKWSSVIVTPVEVYLYIWRHLQATIQF